MAASLVSTSRALPALRRGDATTARVVPNKKALSFDESWKKGYWGTGLFVEGKEARGTNYFASIEKKGVLSAVEKAGLLSQAEKAGLTLGAIERLGLLSTAERLGLLETAETALVTDPGKITALSIAPLLVTLLVLSVFPDDNAALAIAKYGIAAVSGGAFLTLFAAGYVVSSLQE
jgi:hypothetical protein